MLQVHTHKDSLSDVATHTHTRSPQTLWYAKLNNLVAIVVCNWDTEVTYIIAASKFIILELSY